MKNDLWRGLAFAAAAGGAFLLGAACWADSRPVEEVRRVGATTLVYKGPQVDIAISNRYSKLNPEGHWLMLDTTMTATKAPVEVPRSAITLLTPSGTEVALATAKQYYDAYPTLAWTITKDNATREPLGLLIPKPTVPLRYFPLRGIGLAFDSEWLGVFRNSYGRLFFRLPATIQHGTYELRIKLSESDVVIPFAI